LKLLLLVVLHLIMKYVIEETQHLRLLVDSLVQELTGTGTRMGVERPLLELVIQLLFLLQLPLLTTSELLGPVTQQYVNLLL
jgi:hypothetical protein